MATKVKTKHAGLIEVPGGKYIEISGPQKGFKEGQKVVAFRRDEMCEFTVDYPESHQGKKHVEAGTVLTMHVLDAAIAQSLGKGKITKLLPLPKRKWVDD